MFRPVKSYLVNYGTKITICIVLESILVEATSERERNGLKKKSKKLPNLNKLFFELNFDNPKEFPQNLYKKT